MATEEHKFPPQTQHHQPGQQHQMDPIPQSLHPDYKPSNKLHGKVALVTGGDSGIGQAICYHFALEGATVAFTYVPGVEEQDAKVTLKKIQELKVSDAKDPIAVPADLGFDENCNMVVDEVVNFYGHIDILVNNAGEQHMTNTIEEINEDRLLRVFRTNIFSQFFLTRHALKHMKEGSSIINSTSVVAYCGSAILLDYCSTKGAIVSFTRGLALQLADKGIQIAITGLYLRANLRRHALKHMKEGSSIINSTSVVAYCGSAILLDYCSTKGAIVSFTRGLALQLADKGIRVNAVASGPVWTPLRVASLPENLVQKSGSETPMKRAAHPHEIAPSYVFLASDQSSYFTGQVFHPNGGMIVNA